MASPSNLLASPATQQQMLLNQVMNRNPQTQALAQVMAQSMAQGVRIPFMNPYANNLQLLASANNLNGLSNSNVGSTGSSSGSSNSNSNSASSSSSNSNSNNLANNGEQQVAASSTNRAKFFSRLNPLNLFKRLRTRNQKNNSSKQNNKDQSNDINNNIPDLEDRSQFFLPAELLLGSASTNSQQQQLPQLSAQQQQQFEQISAQLAQLNMQLAQQSNNKAKFLRKMGSNGGNNFVFPSSSTAASTKKVAKRDISNQLNSSSAEEPTKKKETILYTLEGDQSPKSGALKSNGTNSNDTETAENGFFPVADLYQNYKFNIRPRFRFPSVREQRRISNAHGLHVNTNNFLTSSSMKSNFIGLMGSRCVRRS